MLRVAHVLNSAGNGGVPRVAHALVRHADRARIAPYVFYLKASGGADLFEGSGIPRRVASSGSKAVAMTELVCWLDANRIDILHTHSFRPNLYGRMAGAVKRPDGLKIVAHYHNDYSDKWQGDVLLLERSLAGVTDAAIAVSDSVATHLRDQVGLTAKVIGNGIDIARVTGGCRDAGRQTLGLAQGDFVVGLIGRICRQKGVDTLVEAAIQLCALLPQAHFIAVGDPEDKPLAEALRMRVNAARLAKRITFAGHRRDMGDVLAALDLLVAPSRWEGFGLVLAEAMAAGVPVLASTVGSIPGVLQGAGVLVPPEDATALGAAIAQLADDPERRALMARCGQVRAARFDWARSTLELEALYERLGVGA